MVSESNDAGSALRSDRLICLNPECEGSPLSDKDSQQCSLCKRRRVVAFRYWPTRLFKRGPYGIVFLAEDRSKWSKSLCVIKQFHYTDTEGDLLRTWKMHEAILKEGGPLERMSQSPDYKGKVPGLLGCCAQEGISYIIVDYIEGPTLEEEMQREGGVLSETAVKKVLANICEQLVILHGFGVVHGNIKPNNIIRRNTDKKYLLSDYAFEKRVVKEILNPAEPVPSPKTEQEAEVFVRRQCAADLLSIGQTAAQMLTGRQGMDHTSFKQWRPKRSRPLSRGFKTVIENLLLPDIDRRIAAIPSTQALLDLLQNSKLDTRPVTPEREASPPPQAPSDHASLIHSKSLPQPPPTPLDAPSPPPPSQSLLPPVPPTRSKSPVGQLTSSSNNNNVISSSPEVRRRSLDRSQSLKPATHSDLHHAIRIELEDDNPSRLLPRTDSALVMRIKPNTLRPITDGTPPPPPTSTSEASPSPPPPPLSSANYATDVVPKHMRVESYRSYDLFLQWMMLSMTLLFVSLGVLGWSLYPMGVPALTSSALVGSLIGSAGVAYSVMQGPKTGAWTLVYSRTMFGPHGNSLILLLDALCLVSVLSVNVSIVQATTGLLLQLDRNASWSLSILFTLSVCALSTLGPRRMMKFFKVSRLVVIFSYVGLMFHSINAAKGGKDVVVTGQIDYLGGWLSYAALICGSVGLWGCHGSDLSCFLPSDFPPRQLFLSTWAGTFLGSFLSFALGITLGASFLSTITNATPETYINMDLPTVMDSALNPLSQGWKALTMLGLVVGDLTASATLNYGFTITLSTLCSVLFHIPRILWSALCGCLCLFVASFVGTTLHPLLRSIATAFPSAFLGSCLGSQVRLGSSGKHVSDDPVIRGWRGTLGFWFGLAGAYMGHEVVHGAKMDVSVELAFIMAFAGNVVLRYVDTRVARDPLRSKANHE